MANDKVTTWTTAAGDEVPLTQLSDAHLGNILRMLVRQAMARRLDCLASWLRLPLPLSDSALQQHIYNYYKELNQRSYANNISNQFSSLAEEAYRRGLNWFPSDKPIEACNGHDLQLLHCMYNKTHLPALNPDQAVTSEVARENLRRFCGQQPPWLLRVEIVADSTPYLKVLVADGPAHLRTAMKFLPRIYQGYEVRLVQDSDAGETTTLNKEWMVTFQPLTNLIYRHGNYYVTFYAVTHDAMNKYCGYDVVPVQEQTVKELADWVEGVRHGVCVALAGKAVVSSLCIENFVRAGGKLPFLPAAPKPEAPKPDPVPYVEVSEGAEFAAEMLAPTNKEVIVTASFQHGTLLTVRYTKVSNNLWEGYFRVLDAYWTVLFNGPEQNARVFFTRLAHGLNVTHPNHEYVLSAEQYREMAKNLEKDAVKRVLVSNTDADSAGKEDETTRGLWWQVRIHDGTQWLHNESYYPSATDAVQTARQLLEQYPDVLVTEVVVAVPRDGQCP